MVNSSVISRGTDMEDRIRTKYMTFVKVGQKPKTSEWHIVNNISGFVLGRISWYSAWRQYVVDFAEATFNNSCLDTISEFLTKLNQELRTNPVG